MTIEEKRSQGVLALAVICIFEIGINYLGVLAIKRHAQHAIRLSPAFYYAIILYIACAIGLVKYKIWARYLFIFLFSYKFFEVMPAVFRYIAVAIHPVSETAAGKIVTSLGSLLGIAIFSILPVICIWYLTLPRVKEQFK